MSATRYQVRISCSDCTNQDPQGCFDGDTELLVEEWPNETVKLFSTKEEAEHAGYDATRDCGPWTFDIEEFEEEK